MTMESLLKEPPVTEVTGDRFLTPVEVGARLGVAYQTLSNWRHRGKGPGWVKISGEIGRQGGKVRYPAAALEAYLAARARSGVAR